MFAVYSSGARLQHIINVYAVSGVTVCKPMYCKRPSIESRNVVFRAAKYGILAFN